MIVMLAVVSMPAGAVERGAVAQQLAEGCDALIDQAVKRPYGWAWTDRLDLDHDAKDRRPEVSMQPGATPAAGLVLLWAGVLLDEPRYLEAAVQVARGCVASQSANGNIPSRPSFGPAPVGRDTGAFVPDRASTRASLALLLACMGADPSKDEMFRRSALRASGWLAKQQTNDGGWPSEAPIVDDSEPPPTRWNHPRRVIRLDTTDFRDSTVALLLSTNAANDRVAGRAADKSIQKLLDLRIGGRGELSSLWFTFYRLDGALDEKRADWPPGADVLASRRAIEALLAVTLLTETDDARIAARDAAATLAKTRHEDATWQRLYPLRPQPAPDAPTTTESIFDIPQPPAPPDPRWSRHDFGIPPVLEIADQLADFGPDEVRSRLAEYATVQERLATMLCGLSDSPFAMDVRSPTDLWEQRETTELENRVLGVYELLLRAREELREDGQ